MKKIVCLILIASMLFTVVACEDKNDEGKNNTQDAVVSENTTEGQKSDVYVNEEYDRKNMKNIYGEAVNINDDNVLYGNRKNGYIVVCRDMSEEYKNPLGVSPLGLSDKAYVSEYVLKKYVDILTDEDYMKSLTEEEVTNYYQDMFSNSFNSFAYVLVVKNDEESKKTYDNIKDKYAYDELLCDFDNTEYHFLYNDNYDDLDVSEEDKHDLDLIFSEYENIKRNLILFTKVAPKALSETSSLNKFKTKDVEGNEVDQKIFSDYDITMVNIWATHCGPCIDEMDELQKVYEKLPEGSNLISICEDASDNLELANEILEKKGVKFKTLLSSDSLRETILKNISATPTTVFIDKNGNIVGDELVGAPGRGDEVIESYLKILDEKLDGIHN